MTANLKIDPNSDLLSATIIRDINANAFVGNTLICGDIPDNSIIRVYDGSLIVLGSVGREVTLITRRESPILFRAATEITGNQHRVPALAPALDLNFGKGKSRWTFTLAPLSIAVLSPVPDRAEEDKQYNLDPNYHTLRIDSLGSVLFTHDTPPRMNATGADDFYAMRSTGVRNCLDFGGHISVAKMIGHVNTLTCGDGISTHHAGESVALSSAGNIYFYSPQTSIPAMQSGAISSAKLVSFYNLIPNRVVVDGRITSTPLSPHEGDLVNAEYHKACCRSQTLTGISLHR